MTKAKLLALTAALFVSAIPALARQNTKYDPASVARGQQNFSSTCGFCHGATGKGGEKGPDLQRSVLVLNDESGEKIGPVVLNGRPEKGMPRFPLTPAQISDIANFLHNSIEAAKNRGDYKILNIVTGDSKAGEAYFNGTGKCTSCHSVSGDLKGIASKYDPATLQTRMIAPEAGNPITVRVTTASGDTATGVPRHLDDFTVALVKADGTYLSFKRLTPTNPRVEVINKLQAHLNQLRVYTDSDIHNLTAYLVTVK